MSEGKEDQSGEKTINRRDFIKMLGITSVGLALTACTRSKERISELSFLDIEKGAILPLEVSGRGKLNVYVDYFNGVDKLVARMHDGKGVTEAFSGGSESIRRMGEITEPELKKITGINTASTLFVYPMTTGNKLDNFGRQEFSLRDNVFALPVITTEIDLVGSAPPAENNKNNSLPSTFGQGLAVGKLNSVGGKDVFQVEGYICDARAVSLE
jgi:hypothetical protein